MRIVIFLKDPDSLVIIDWLRTGQLNEAGSITVLGTPVALEGSRT